MKDAKVIAAVLWTVLASTHPGLARASASWYLLVPPAAYDAHRHLYERSGDASLAEWYRDGEYLSERACRDARAAKAREAGRLERKRGDADDFYHVQAWAMRHGRCLSAAALRERH
ncbi:MAG TPA: hypothetical protein VJX92_14720 [Methylomirabilota bacterium]|nr:hypothetical protein [Methylomirabilota bacterium]